MIFLKTWEAFLITLLNNIYYFPPEERKTFFKKLLPLLSPNGALIVVSAMQGGSPMNVGFDLIVRSTEGVYAIPELEELTLQLKESGFHRVSREQVLLGESFYLLIAKKQ